MENNDLMDKDDMVILVRSVLKLALHDYITLQHPIKRVKKANQQSFETAVDMLFDDTYVSMRLMTDDCRKMRIHDILDYSQPENKVTVSHMREKVAEQAREYWDNMELKTINVPTHLTVRGYSYTIIAADYYDFGVDYDGYVIYLNTKEGQQAQRLLVKACLLLAEHYSEDEDSKANVMFEILRMNDCFR